MDKDTADKLINLNRQFYQTFAADFAETRLRLQPGVHRCLERAAASACILDLGCGNGECRRALAARGNTAVYTGLDFSPALLKYAASASPCAAFITADLATPGWEKLLPEPAYDAIFAFAVMHHLPGNGLRMQIFEQIHRLLTPGGYFFHSHWQFLNSPRLRQRILPWETVGLSAEQVDPDDYLLDWRRGGLGIRYVHQFAAPELASLAQASGFEIVDSFPSDGQGGKLSLYQVWQIE